MMTFEQEHREVQQRMWLLQHGWYNWKLYAALATVFLSAAFVLMSIGLVLRSNDQADRLAEFRREAACRSAIGGDLNAAAVDVQLAMARLIALQAEAYIARYDGRPPLPDNFAERYRVQAANLADLQQTLETLTAAQRNAVEICE